jgi:general stress protein YciG
MTIKNTPPAGEQQGTAPRKRGFAAMDPERMREIAAMGGRIAHEQGRAHKFNSAEGQAAGRKRAAQMQEERERKQRLMAQGITQDAQGVSTATISTPRGSLGEDA